MILNFSLKASFLYIYQIAYNHIKLHIDENTIFSQKTFFGKDDNDVQLGHTAVKNQAKNLKRVWNNEKHDDIGLEKILRLFW